MSDRLLKDATVNILGSDWRLRFVDRESDPQLKEVDGYTDITAKLMVIDDQRYIDNDSVANLYAYKQRVVRHEIIHAYLMESGLDSSSLEHEAWARNEEMVDWFALQAPKIYKTFEEVGCM